MNTNLIHTSINNFLSKLQGDKWIWAVIFALSIVSILAVYSSTGTLAYKESKNTFYYLLKHGIFLVAGLGIVYATHLFDYKYYYPTALIGLGVSILLLIYTLLNGARVNEASRWITLPIINQTFQTSDLAKLMLFMYLARDLAAKKDKIRNFKEGFLPMLLAIGVVCALIAPYDLSTALMVFGTSMLLLLIGRVSFGQMAFVGIIGLCIITAVVFFGPRKGVYRDRVSTFLSPESVSSDKRFQRDQATIAIASGGLLGKGPGNSTQRNFLPSPYADFVFAIIIEEYGIIGGLFIISVYLLFLFRCLKLISLSERQQSPFGAFLAIALGFSLVIQAFLNMAVATGVLPVTGVTLPLVSMGGTSVLFTSVAFGIILSVSRDLEDKQKTAAIPVRRSGLTPAVK